jgi:O-antigen biosynthesis protein
MTTLNLGIQNLVGAPLGLPFGVPTLPFINKNSSSGAEPPAEIPGAGLKRAIVYLADYGGCGYYRCMAPTLLLNLYQKAVIVESTAMILDPRFYETVETIKFQRQATPPQRDFIRMMRDLANKANKKLIYEIDDVVFAEDIPLYNRNRVAFTPPEIQQCIKDILSMMDEITVTNEYFRDYMIHKSGNPKVSVIPNYLPKSWFDRYYNLWDLTKRFDKNKKRPIVAIFASGTHVDVMNRVNQQDDFAPVIRQIAATVKDFDWRFYGSYPLPLKPLIDSGHIKFFQWAQLPDFPEVMAKSGAQITFASLQDNNFNRCKSNIKLIESGALGMPCICPDMVTYKDAFLKYRTGDELIDVLKDTLKHQSVYAQHCEQARKHAEKFWLEDEQNLMKHHEAYFTPFGSKERKYLV